MRAQLWRTQAAHDAETYALRRHIAGLERSARAPARFTAETGERENDMLHDVSIDMCPYPSMDNADLMQTGET